MVSSQRYYGSDRLRRRIGRRRFLQGAAGVAGLALAACGSSKSNGSSGKTNSTSASGPAAASSAAAGSVTPTGSIVVNVSGLGTQDYNPLNDQGSGEVLINDHVGEALAIMGPQKNVYIPAIATKWTATPDAKTWTFTIRDGVKFHDGSTLTPDDVKFTTEQYTAASRKKVSAAKLAQLLDSVQVNGNTVVFTLNAPYADMIVLIASMQIIPQAAWQKAGDEAFGQHPIGAGPFKFVSATRDSQVVLEAFEQCYRKVPAVKQVTFKIVPEAQTRLAQLQTNAADISLQASGPMIPVIQGDKNLKLRDDQSTSMDGILFTDQQSAKTWQSGPFADPRVRQAVAHAIDLKTIADKIYFGKAQPVAVPWAVPGIPGIDPTLKPYSYDVAEAKKLLAAAGQSQIKAVIYTYDSAAIGGNLDVTQAVSGYLNAVGIQNTVQPLEYATYLAKQRAGAWSGQGALAVPVQAGRAGESFYPSLDPTTSTPYAYNPDLQAEAKQQEETGDTAERNKLIADLSRKLYQDLPNVPLLSPDYLQGLGPKIQDWQPRFRLGFPLGLEYAVLKG